jgi:hypothetical protein
MSKLPAATVDKIAIEIYEAAAREYIQTNAARRNSGGRHKKYLGMSQVGDPCERKLWYDFRKFTRKPFEGRMALLFNEGDIYEEKLVKYLTLAGYGIERTGKDQLEFSDFDELFKGHSDGLIHGVTRRTHVLELKTANKNKFASFQRFGIQKTYPVYYSQAQCYMGYSGFERALFVVYCKDNSNIYTERIHFIRQDFEALRQRALRIISANEPLSRAFDSSAVMDCQWCDYRLHCWSAEGMIMTDDRTCGSCWYSWWQGLRSCCLHPDHPYFIQTWGMACPDWSYLFDKELGPHELNRKQRVELSEIREPPDGRH